MVRYRLSLLLLCLLFVAHHAGLRVAHADAGLYGTVGAKPIPVRGLKLQLSKLSLTELERRLETIDSQLEWLCPISLRSGVGAVGIRSSVRSDPHHAEWFEVELAEAVPVHYIALVPTIWRDTKTGLRADGFPIEFRVVVGTDGDSEGTVVASYSAEDRLLPRIAPLVVECPGIIASWVRVEAIELSPRLWDSQYVFQLSELFVFSGDENVAQSRPVRTSSSSVAEGRHHRYLVDGFVPYLMDAREGEQSIAFLREGAADGDYEFTIDLGATRPLNRIHLHAIDLSDTIPQANRDGIGIPKQMRLEGANQTDFSDAVLLQEFDFPTVYDLGPIIMRRFPRTPCRYVRLTAIEPDAIMRGGKLTPRIGFAEIELFSDEKNVAAELPFEANFVVYNPMRPLSALTDGRNFYGTILPIREWMIELALRHELETERPYVAEELNRRYSQQKVHLTWLTWLAVLLAVGIGVTIMIDRVVRMRQLANLKERFAADLHDELGANLHVIGLLGDLAQAAVGSPEKLKSLHQRIRVMTERSGTAVQYCTNILEAKGLYQDLYEDMQRTTQRIMADIDGELSFEGDADVLKRLGPRTRADLFLFYKECLVNISRHSQATQFDAHLTASGSDLSLVVSDNGHGLTAPLANKVPPSLQRRARLLGAQVTAKHPSEGGTHIELNLRTRKWGRRK